MKKLAEISNFGNIDAKLDELLFDCFEEHPAYLDAVNFKKFLILGKKGTGKTSIFRMLLNLKGHNIFNEGYNLNSYPWAHHKLQVQIGVPDSQRYVESWKYLILMELCKIIVNKDNSNYLLNDEQKESFFVIKNFIKDTYGNTNPDVKQIFTPGRKLQLKGFLGIKAFGQEYGIQLPVESVEMKELPTIISEVNRNLMYHLMKCVNPQNDYYICFDELDIGFENTKEYKDLLIALIRAARDFFIEAKDNSKRVNICVFLRDDIYEVLKFEDKRKVTQNFVSRVEWDIKSDSKTLKEMMEKRFNKLLRDESDEKVKWDTVFDETKQINGKNSKYKYIKEMTCLRPRDMIDFCNIILKEYKNNYEKNHFINQDIISAKEEYSSNLYEEFVDEIHKHIPEFEVYFEMIRKLGKTKFTLVEFEEIYTKFSKKLKENIGAEEILKKLFEFSIIGNYRIGGVGSGSKKVFKYKDVRAKFDEEGLILVHQGLSQTFNLKEK